MFFPSYVRSVYLHPILYWKQFKLKCRLCVVLYVLTNFLEMAQFTSHRQLEMFRLDYGYVRSKATWNYCRPTTKNNSELNNHKKKMRCLNFACIPIELQALRARGPIVSTVFVIFACTFGYELLICTTSKMGDEQGFQNTTPPIPFGALYTAIMTLYLVRVHTSI